MDERPERHDLELYLLRHADAGDPSSWAGDDASRPLTDVGVRQAEALAEFLSARGFSIDEVISSPKLRAVQTAEPIARALGTTVRRDDRLAGPLDLDRLESLLDAARGRRVMIVGHDPDLSELAATLSGASYLPLKKSALVRVDVALPLQPAGGIVRWLLPPEIVAAR